LLRNFASSVTLLFLYCHVTISFFALLTSFQHQAVAHVQPSFQELIAEAKRKMDKAERNMDKAERDLDEAQAELARLKAAKASKEDIQRAQNSVENARSAWQATVEAHKAAMEAETAARAANRGGAASGVREEPFSFKPDVLERLKRPLSEWQAGETFDVTGIQRAIGGTQWHDVVFLRAEGLAVLREWESKTPFLAVYGTPGIGKSTLLQLAAMRALVLGDPVLLHVRGVEKLIQIVDDALLRVERLTLDDVGFGGRPRVEDTVMCYDSRKGFQETVGHANVFKKTLIVHSPSGDLNNTRKAEGVRSRFFAVPTEAELVALGALVKIEADEVRRRVARYGPIIRYLFDADEAETSIDAGISRMVDAGVEGLADLSRASRDVHRITLMVRKPTPVGVMLVFASDYVRDEVVRRVAEKREADLLRLVNVVDIHGSLRGQVFENRMLDKLCRANAKILFETDGGNKVLQIAGAGVTLCKTDGALTLPAGILQHLVVYRPPHSNNASWDALVVESDQVAYLLQMTVASAHPVKQHGLVAGKSLLAKAGFQGEVRLVFLLPPAAFSGFRVPQTIQNADGSQSVTTWPQEKWCVAEVDDGGAFWR
jgi:hypothetical protein